MTRRSPCCWNRIVITYLVARLQLDRTLLGKISGSDAVQETFLNAKRGFSEFKGNTDRELTAWLLRMLANRLAELTRHFVAQKRDVTMERTCESGVDQSSHDLGRWLSANIASPSEQVHQREQAVLLADALGSLPSEYREVLVLGHM